MRNAASRVGRSAQKDLLDAEEWRDLVNAYLDHASAAVTQMGGHVAKKLDINIVVDKRRRVSLQANLRQPFRNLLHGPPPADLPATGGGANAYAAKVASELAQDPKYVGSSVCIVDEWGKELDRVSIGSGWVKVVRTD